MADQLRIELIGSTGQFDTPIKRSTETAIKFDSALGKIANETEVLNALGIKTQTQIKNEINVRQQLINLLGDRQPQAVNLLKAQQEQLNREMMQGVEHNRSMQQAVFSLGFIIDDASQFSLGFSQGVRAISNNMIPLISQIALATGKLANLTPIILGVQVVMSALVIMGPKLDEFFAGLGSGAKDSAEKVKDLNEELEGLVRLEALPQLAAISTEELERLGTRAAAVADATQRGIDLVADRIRNLGEVVAVPFADPVRQITEEQQETLSAMLLTQRELRQELDKSIAVQETFTSALEKRQRQERLLQILTAAGLALEEEGNNDGPGGKQRTLTLLEKLNEQINEQISLNNQLYGLEGLQIARKERFLEQLEAEERLRRNINRELERQGRGDFIGLTPLFPGAPEGVGGPGDLRGEEAADAAQKNFARMERDAERFNQRLNRSLVDGVAQTVAGFAEALGGLAAGSVTIEQAAGQILSSIGGLAVRLGRILFLSGIGIESLKKSLLALTGAPAIIAGLALIAAGSAIRGLASSFGGGGSSAGSSASGSGLFAATPGTTSGPTGGTAGFPLPPGLNYPGVPAINVNITGTFTQRGPDLYAVVKTAEGTQRALGRT